MKLIVVFVKPNTSYMDHSLHSDVVTVKPSFNV